MFWPLSALVFFLVFPLGYSERWAVLIAGAGGYNNYRHQTASYRMFNMLVDRGLSIDKIITFNFILAYLIQNEEVDYKVYAKPHGPNVYENFVNKYNEAKVTPTAVKQVLTGDKAAGGPVLQTTAEDYVFLYYVGMGGEGVVRCGGVYHLDPSEVPDPTYLYQSDLKEIVNVMREKKMFKKMFIYMASCHGESMLSWLDTDNVKDVYAISASGETTMTHAIFCPNPEHEDWPMRHINTCLAERSSAMFMGRAEHCNLNDVTLGWLVDWTKNATSRKREQHMTEHGDMSVREETASNFLGDKTAKSTSGIFKASRKLDKKLRQMMARDSGWNEYDHDEMIARVAVNKERDEEEKEELQETVNEIVEKRAKVNKVAKKVAVGVLGDEAKANKMFDLGLSKTTNFECFKATFEKYENCTEDVKSYGLENSQVFFNLCTSHSQADVMTQLEKSCAA